MHHYGPHGHLFRDLETHYKQVKYCQTHFKYVVSAHCMLLVILIL